MGSIAFLGGLQFVHTDFAWSLARMCAYTERKLLGPDQEIVYLKSNVSEHRLARNDIAFRTKGDWLFTLDTDHSFEPDLLIRMLNCMSKYNLDVLSGLYRHKAKPYPPVAFMKHEGGLYEVVGGFDMSDGSEICEVDAVGGGCMLIKTEVFRRIYNELKENPFDMLMPLSEDISFCSRVQRLGLKIFINPNIEAYHLMTQPLTHSDYDTGPFEKGRELTKVGFGNG